MKSEQFLQSMMAEYEHQWMTAAGHQVRHPLREKMRRLSELIARRPGDEELDALLLDGPLPEDPLDCLLCEELGPRWAEVRGRASSRPGADHGGVSSSS